MIIGYMLGNGNELLLDYGRSFWKRQKQSCPWCLRFDGEYWIKCRSCGLRWHAECIFEIADIGWVCNRCKDIENKTYTYPSLQSLIINDSMDKYYKPRPSKRLLESDHDQQHHQPTTTAVVETSWSKSIATHHCLSWSVETWAVHRKLWLMPTKVRLRS